MERLQSYSAYDARQALSDMDTFQQWNDCNLTVLTMSDMDTFQQWNDCNLTVLTMLARLLLQKTIET